MYKICGQFFWGLHCGKEIQKMIVSCTVWWSCYKENVQSCLACKTCIDTLNLEIVCNLRERNATIQKINSCCKPLQLSFKQVLVTFIFHTCMLCTALFISELLTSFTNCQFSSLLSCLSQHDISEKSLSKCYLKVCSCSKSLSQSEMPLT